MAVKRLCVALTRSKLIWREGIREADRYNREGGREGRKGQGSDGSWAGLGWLQFGERVWGKRVGQGVFRIRIVKEGVGGGAVPFMMIVAKLSELYKR